MSSTGNMYLVISGQDIRSMTCGVFDGVVMSHEQTLRATPEQYLASLDQLLRDWDLSTHQFDGVIVVTGPGSFTASRVSTTIANGVAFAKSIPVFALENPERLPLSDLLARNELLPASYAIPAYDRPPHITRSTKNRGDNARD